MTMNIAIISAVYPPEPLISASMAHDLAVHFVKHGYGITVICPQPSRPVKADFRRYKISGLPFVTHEDGVKIVRLPSFTSPESRLLPRLYESWSFGTHAIQYIEMESHKPDVIYVNSWPLLAQAKIMCYAERHKIPAILQIMDIYPEALFAKLPAILRRIVFPPLLRLDSFTAQKARSVVVISDNMRHAYIESRGIPDDRVVTIPTWQDDSLFENAPGQAYACSHYSIPNGLFTFLYLGNIGPVAGVDFLIRAFRDASLAAAQLVIVGEGTAKQECVKMVDRMKIAHVHFLSDLNIANVPLLQSMADVCLLPMKSGTGMSSIPSKLPAYLFSAKPVLATVDADSDTARLIQQAGCGWIGPPEDLDWLSSKMRVVAAMTDDNLSALGEKGKAFGRVHYSKSLGVKRLADIIISRATDHKQKSSQ